MSLAVRLRDLDVADVPAVLELLADERVIRYMRFPPFTEERTLAFVERVRAERDADPRTSATFAIADGGELVGLCGLTIGPQPESGEAWYLLRPRAWGRGIATAAVRELLDFAFGELALHRVSASVLPDNPASARVLEKLGLRREGYRRQNERIRGEWHDSWLYAILRDEWSPGGRRDAGAVVDSAEAGGLRITVETEPRAADRRVVERGLLAFNIAVIGEPAYLELGVFARGAGGHVLGGLLGHTRWGALYVASAWLPEELRGRGLGTRLLAAAEAFARQRGCALALLDTFEFQALPFYVKQGYTHYATVVGYPAGRRQFLLRKTLA